MTFSFSPGKRTVGALVVLPLFFLLTGTLSPELVERGSSYLKPFKMQLKAASVKGVQSGPINAVTA